MGRKAGPRFPNLEVNGAFLRGPSSKAKLILPLVREVKTPQTTSHSQLFYI